MKRNVLHLVPSFHQGGSESQAIQLAGMMSQNGTYDVRLACLEKNGVLLEKAERLGFTDIAEFSLTSFYDRNMIKQLRRFVGFLNENAIEVVQAHDFYTNIFGMLGARLANVPVRIAAKRETGMRTGAQLFIERRAFGLAGVIAANSHKVKSYLIDCGVPARKIEVVYNGIDADGFNLPSTDRARLLADFGLPTDKPIRYVTMVANLRSRVKNHKMFLRAAADVAADIKDVGFIVAGEGELLAETKTFSEQLGLPERVFLIGRCNRVPELLNLSHVGVLTSESEGFSNSLLEYMAAGRPVVATDVGGAAEAVVDGETGFLVESNDHKALAEKLRVLLNDENLSHRMGEAGRQQMLERFSSSAQLERTMSIYERELGRIKKSRMETHT